jgi:serine/threonine protein kinase
MKGKNCKTIKHEIESVLNEIRCLAKLKNEFVVGYNHSWIEASLKNNNQVNRKSLMNVKKNKYQKSEEIEHSFDNISFAEELSSNSSFVLFYENSKDFNDDNYSETSQYSQDSSNEGLMFHLKESKSEVEEQIFINGNPYEITQIEKLIIYIQMELCKETLGDYILKTSESNESSSEFSNIFEIHKNLKIFINILKAIEYIHSKESLIHRDLKPNNIFFTNDMQVKLGDFGLATQLYDNKYRNKGNRKNSILSTCSETSNLYNSSPLNFSVSYHTKNVGTLQYASPEQLSDNYYDQKSDIFSLGLILYEMLFSFKTGMEKNAKFKELKNGTINSEFLEKYPRLSKIILSMVEKIPEKRPCAPELIKQIECELEDLTLKLENERRNPLEFQIQFESDQLFKKM